MEKKADPLEQVRERLQNIIDNAPEEKSLPARDPFGGYSSHGNDDDIAADVAAEQNWWNAEQARQALTALDGLRTLKEGEVATAESDQKLFFELLTSVGDKEDWWVEIEYAGRMETFCKYCDRYQAEGRQSGSHSPNCLYVKTRQYLENQRRGGKDEVAYGGFHLCPWCGRARSNDPHVKCEHCGLTDKEARHKRNNPQRKEGEVMLWENLQTYCRAFKETDLSSLGSNYTDFASFFAQHKMDYCVRIVAQSPSSCYNDHIVFELRLYVGDGVFGASQRLSTLELCRWRSLNIPHIAQDHCLNMVGNLLKELE
jgi:hypothetical protein